MSAKLVEAISEGSFPDDETILSSDLEQTLIPSLLVEIDHTKQVLSKSISEISSKEATDVDGWIAQAKKVQADIAKCKDDALQIVQEYELLQSLRDADNEAQAKVTLLDDEIAFNDSLRGQIEAIAQTSQALNQTEADIDANDLIAASNALPQIKDNISAIRGEEVQGLLRSIYGRVAEKLTHTLQQEVEKCLVIEHRPDAVVLRLLTGKSDGTAFDFDHVLAALDRIDCLAATRERVADRVTRNVMSHLHTRSRFKLASAQVQGNECVVGLSSSAEIGNILEATDVILSFLQAQLPSMLNDHITHHLTSRLSPMLIDNWLTPAIPAELDEFQSMELLRDGVKRLIATIRAKKPSDAVLLETWLDGSSKTWLYKRRMVSLDAVRKAFGLATGVTRQVDRVEKQVFIAEVDASHHSTTDDEWNDNWGDEDTSAPEPKNNVADEASDAWGFDTDEQDDAEKSKDGPVPTSTEDDIDADAWGWGDEEDENSKLAKTPNEQPKQPPNGTSPVSKMKSEEVVLTEQYTITDVPDHILERIGKDIADLQLLSSPQQSFFTATDRDLVDLKSLPALILSMFRAMSVTAYTSGSGKLPMLSAMNLYNDTLYLSQRLSEHHEPISNFASELVLLDKFARQTYTNELSTQRQILSDLFDNAQGFVDCTREPNTTVCDNAVSSTVDYIRDLHRQWSSILSPSHTAQSIGSLLSSVMGKMIKDIEDMEDISEAQSQKLLSFMEQISKIEDLFMANPGQENPGEESSPVSTIALHAPSYLRFQYLQQILDSSLVDIRYLWTDAGLRLEFTADEVIDLIRALFADSSHRRSAINAIRS